MNTIKYIFDNKLLEKIADQFSTPCYVYNKQRILENLNNFYAGFKEHNNNNYLVCYAVKANSNLSILKLLAEHNTGFDIVSVGELQRVIVAGGAPNKVVFSGVGKQDFEIKAALNAGIYCFNVESEQELILINQIAQDLNLKAPVSIRVNPDIDAKSHPYISTGLKEHKFGISIKQAEKIYNYAKELSNINIIGIDCHIGSQLTELGPIKNTCNALNTLLQNLASNKVTVSHVNLGGGLGINYQHNKQTTIPNAKDWVATILNNLNFDGKIILEPGRSILGDAGVLLTKVIYNKTDEINHHNFTIIDAAMNDLIRPALYAAEHQVINISSLNNQHEKKPNTATSLSSIVGPVCESSDVFVKSSDIKSEPKDLLAILDAGAYGFSMCSNYNSRTKPCEVLVDNNTIKLIRARETLEDLYKLEILD